MTDNPTTNADTYNTTTLEQVADPSPEQQAKAERVSGMAHAILKALHDSGPMPDVDDAIDACCSALAYLISGLPDDRVFELYNAVGHKVAAGIALQRQLGHVPRVTMLDPERPQ